MTTARHQALVVLAGLAVACTSRRPAPPATAVIEFERGACHGTCPTYAVGVDAAGGVRFRPMANVPTPGERTRTVSAAALAALQTRAADVARALGPQRFVADRPECGAYIADLALITLRVRTGTTWTDLSFDPGCSNAPEPLRRLAADVEALTVDPGWLPPPAP